MDSINEFCLKAANYSIPTWLVKHAILSACNRCVSGGRMPNATSNRVPDDLTAFLADTRDARAYRRGLAVKMAYQGYLYHVIADILGITIGFISHAKTAYETNGIDGLQMHHTGKTGYLPKESYDTVITWIQAQSKWSFADLKRYLEQTHRIVYTSDQSYYNLFAAAGITYKKTQATNPQEDAAAVEVKKKS
jgi:putative transposase